MEFDQNLFINYLPILATILLLLVTSTTVFQKIKLRWPIKIKCWFCHGSTKISREEIDWWLCPLCEQYNGFNKNGDYSYEIPEQYKISMNNAKRYCSTSQVTERNEVPKNNLCSHCNASESLKLLKLSKFEPENELNYEYEVNQYKHVLEKKYPLCSNCKTSIDRLLQKQALWFGKYKALLFKQKPFLSVVNKGKYSEIIFRMISTVLDSIMAYNMDFWFLSIGGLFFQLCACWMAPKKQRSSDMFLVFLWICIIVLAPFKDLKVLKSDLKTVWFSLEYISQYHIIMTFAFIIGFINVKPKSYRTKLSKNMSFKKMETSFEDSVLSDSCTTTSSNGNLSFNIGLSNGIKETKIPSSMTPNNCFTATSLETPSIMRSILLQRPVISQKPGTSVSPVYSSGGFSNCASPYKNSSLDSYLLNESLSTLSALSLSEGSSKYVAQAPNVFERKVYNTRSPDLFRKLNNSSSTKKNILSPPKLKSVMQASWVAGGYWQEGINAPSLSRSSSQSSGFGSAGSNFAPSREPSVHEFDQSSVMSEATQSCYISRQNCMSPVGSLYKPSPQFSFIEPKSPIYNQTVKYMTNQSFSPPSSLLVPNCQRNNTVFMEHCPQGQRINLSDVKGPAEMQIFPSHTTIVTSPVWLPALLCGSLVLNIIVLCTTLLR